MASCLPTRYLYANLSMIPKTDYYSLVKLIERFLRDMVQRKMLKFVVTLDKNLKLGGRAGLFKGKS
ncbi:hypothetical protein HCJ39_14540 [Listeria rocourtiae]|uniref:hypothetical protein n=1 Tax=Listeria rocourtiae TaxID=647910 RepID=UPI001628FEB1|nr:hypothetical protein [Listeria rocourtiae]MBC1605933.1 hypothetical protein [Listeria rocourtiae]